MKKLIFKFLILNSILFFGALPVYALDPVIYFSDITSGPSTGLGDGKGSGAIVTLWGVNLGSTQGASSVQIGGQNSAYVYYWGNATNSANAGPADLYTYHKMQTVSFSIPASAPSGATSITVTVGGITSNTLPFTVRPGRICFISTTGTDNSSNCSFSSPWKTLQYVGTNGGALLAGDIIYVMNGVQETAGWAMYGPTAASQSLPISYIAYPGAIVTVDNAGTFGIGNHSGKVLWANFSKFIVKTNGDGITAFWGMRAIGNEITNHPGGCADGQGGAVTGSDLNGTLTTGGGIKVYGNYIHDFGCSTTAKLHHVFYLSNRSGNIYQSYELGWNYLINNMAYGALHNYDEGACGNWSGNMLEHDNVIINQTAEGLGVATAGATACMSQSIYFYNNLFVNAGRDAANTGHNATFSFQGNPASTLATPIYVYNNTFVGYGDPTNGGSLYQAAGCSCTVTWVNNIVVDTSNHPFLDPSYQTPSPTVHTNNLWYSSFGRTAPSWDTTPIASNPAMVNPVIGGSYILQQNSPAVNTGANTSSIVTKDLRGVLRGMAGTPYDIGAYEFVTTVAPSAPVSLIVK